MRMSGGLLSGRRHVAPAGPIDIGPQLLTNPGLTEDALNAWTIRSGHAAALDPVVNPLRRAIHGATQTGLGLVLFDGAEEGCEAHSGDQNKHVLFVCQHVRFVSLNICCSLRS